MKAFVFMAALGLSGVASAGVIKGVGMCSDDSKFFGMVDSCAVNVARYDAARVGFTFAPIELVARGFSSAHVHAIRASLMSAISVISQKNGEGKLKVKAYFYIDEVAARSRFELLLKSAEYQSAVNNVVNACSSGVASRSCVLATSVLVVWCCFCWGH